MRSPRGSLAPESPEAGFFESLHPDGNSTARSKTLRVTRANVMVSSGRGKRDSGTGPAQARGGGAGGRNEGVRGATGDRSIRATGGASSTWSTGGDVGR